MSWYGEHILPHVINLACSAQPNQKQRGRLVPLAKGEVLEIGFGSGLNVPFYDPDKVSRIWALEPSVGMRRKAQPVVDSSSVDVEFIDLPAEDIPLDLNSMDTVLVTYTLCTIPDAVAALEGMRRVLKPEGSLLFCEHGLAPDEDVRRWQNRLNPAWRKLGGGCNINRDILELIRSAGFDITSDERVYIPGPRPLCYNFRGSAVAAR
jgi:ubiquinone/menaquinone biosynthesis C-methylase UbiE